MKISEIYKITNNPIAVDPRLYLTTQPYLGTRNNNPLQYQIISTRTDYYKYSFFKLSFMRMVREGLLSTSTSTYSTTIHQNSDDYTSALRVFSHMQ
jgi:hypothetical protein